MSSFLGSRELIYDYYLTILKALQFLKTAKQSSDIFKSLQGGIISKLRMCGVCCKLGISAADEERCVGAEFAARELMASSKLPPNWPDQDYKGRMFLNFCDRRNTDGSISNRNMATDNRYMRTYVHNNRTRTQTIGSILY